jgi:hypothetical protein
MACAINAGYALDCRDVVGGIKNIYVTELANKNTITTDASGLITAMTLTTGKQFWKYELLPRGANNATETWTSSPENGTLFADQAIVVQFPKQNSVLRNSLLLLAKNRCLVIVEMKNGEYFLFGEEHGCYAGGPANSGQGMGDFNGYTITLSGQEKLPAKQLQSLFANLLSAAA